MGKEYVQPNFGNVHMLHLEDIAKDIRRLCNVHGLVAVWRPTNRSMRVRIIEKGKVIFNQVYTEIYWHQNIAMMYAGLHDFLVKKDIEWNKRQQLLRHEQKLREEEARIAAMPSWADKIREQKNLTNEV